MGQPHVTPTHLRPHAFKPFRGDVADGYARIDLPGLGAVWARIAPSHAAYREHVEDVPYIVHCLGWGSSPGVRWGELDRATRERLLATLMTR